MRAKSVIKFVLSETKKMWKYQAALVVILLLGAFLTILFSLQIKIFVNSVVRNNINTSQLLFLILLGLGAVVAFWIGIYFLEILKRRAQVNLWKRLYDRIAHADMLEFKKESPGEYISKVLSDTALVGGLIGGLVPAILTNSIHFLSYMIALWIINPYLCILTLLFLPLFVIIYLKQAKGLLFASLMERKSYASVTESLRNKVEAVNMIKSFRVEKNMSSVFEKDCSSWYGKIKMVIFIMQSYRGIYTALTMIVPLIVIFIGGISTSIDAGTLFSYFYVSQMAMGPLTTLVTDLGGVSQALPAVNRVKNVLELKQEKFGNLSLNKIETVVLQDVHFKFNSVKVLNGVNLQIKRGEHIGIVGRTGSGKSTLAKIINGIYKPDKGTVKISGIPINRYNKELRNKIILCSGDDPILPATLRENITLYDSNFSDEDVCRVLKIVELNELSLDEKIGPGNREVSLGQGQRIALARALIRKPECIILDEALSGVNPDMEKRIMLRIKNEIPIVIMISHRESIKNYVDKIYNLENGLLKIKNACGIR